MDLEFIKEKATEVSKEMNDRKQMLDEQNIKVKGKGLTFNLVKYGTAITPIVLPFALIYYFSHDFWLALMSTFIIDITLFAGLVYYTLHKVTSETLE